MIGECVLGFSFFCIMSFFPSKLYIHYIRDEMQWDMYCIRNDMDLDIYTLYII